MLPAAKSEESVKRKHHDLLAWQQGIGRNSTKDLLQYLIVARGSLAELDTYVVLARELEYLHDTVELETQLDRVFGLIGGLINSYRGSSGAA